jgi:hypothetical protein
VTQQREQIPHVVVELEGAPARAAARVEAAVVPGEDAVARPETLEQRMPDAQPAAETAAQDERSAVLRAGLVAGEPGAVVRAEAAVLDQAATPPRAILRHALRVASAL